MRTLPFPGPVSIVLPVPVRIVRTLPEPGSVSQYFILFAGRIFQLTVTGPMAFLIMTGIEFIAWLTGTDSTNLFDWKRAWNVPSIGSGGISISGKPRASCFPALWTNIDCPRSEEHTSELQSPYDLVCRLLLEKK